MYKSLPMSEISEEIKREVSLFLKEKFERYDPKDVIGTGSSSVVFSAFDKFKREMVAIKVPIKQCHSVNDLKKEFNILKYFNCSDTKNVYGIIRAVDSFTWHDRMCLVFEKFSCSLNSILTENNFCGLSLKLIQKVAKQLCVSLRLFLQKDFIHCNLKPQNIFFKNNSNFRTVRMGGLSKACHKIYPTNLKYTSSNYYISPEVLLGLPFNQSIDIWSIGCILFELFCGEPLFKGANETDQMKKIIEVLGKPSLNHCQIKNTRATMLASNIAAANSIALELQLLRLFQARDIYEQFIARINQSSQEDNDCHDLNLIEVRKKSTVGKSSKYNKRRAFYCRSKTCMKRSSKLQESLGDGEQRSKSIFEMLKAKASEPFYLPIKEDNEDDPHDQELKLFEDLILKMLKYNPKERISCLEVLQHEFFTLYGCRSKRKGQPDKLSSLGKKGTDFGSKPDIATFRITDTDSDGRVAIYDHPFSYTMINRSATPISNLQLLAEQKHQRKSAPGTSSSRLERKKNPYRRPLRDTTFDISISFTEDGRKFAYNSLGTAIEVTHNEGRVSRAIPLKEIEELHMDIKKQKRR